MGWHKIISVSESSSRNFKEISFWEGFVNLWTRSWTDAGGYNSSEQFFILLDLKKPNETFSEQEKKRQVRCMWGKINSNWG